MRRRPFITLSADINWARGTSVGISAWRAGLSKLSAVALQNAIR